MVDRLPERELTNVERFEMDVMVINPNSPEGAFHIPGVGVKRFARPLGELRRMSRDGGKTVEVKRPDGSTEMLDLTPYSGFNSDEELAIRWRPIFKEGHEPTLPQELIDRAQAGLRAAQGDKHQHD